jgi:tRNA-intron endonuclease
MATIGELRDNKIIIKKSKDIGKLYNKSRFGETTPGNRLELDLLEGVFLIDEGKIRVFRNNQEVYFDDLVKTAASHTSRFEIRYLIFRDLRKRGHIIRICDEEDDFDFYISNKRGEKQYGVTAFSERDLISINTIKALADNADNQNLLLWFAIVDEEGDITYYDIALSNIQGPSSEHKFFKTIGTLLEDRVIVFDKERAERLLKKEFYGKPFGDGLQLSLVETTYLIQRGVLEIQDADGNSISPEKFRAFVKKTQPDIDSRIKVFSDLKNRGLIVKTGFKFGAHFRAYAKKPDETHAEYLVHVVEHDFQRIWAEISRAVRLAHAVNKKILFAKVKEPHIDYIKFGRVRP